MPSYVATHSGAYNAADGASQSNFSFGSGTFSDGNDEEWLIGESLTEDPPQTITFGDPTTYVGYITVNGTDYPVVEFFGNQIVLFDNVTDFNARPLDLTGQIVTTSFTACFAAGTGIETPTGLVSVEDLTTGDLVLNAEGDAVAVKWIGRQTISTRFGPADRLMPVRMKAGSLGDGLPHTDLTVTADHGMLVDGVICHAGTLVNGTTIARVPLAEMGETYTVYHIETDAHEIILANGAPAETFIDNVSRKVFDNYAEFETLYGDVPEMRELSYPRAMSMRQVPNHVLARLAGNKVA